MMETIQFKHDRDIWVTSDTHAYHKNITRGTTSWEPSKISQGHEGYRDFDTIEEMTLSVVDGINSNVKEYDILFHLGDWSFNGIDNIWNFRKQLNVKNIHIILGNHDQHIVPHKKILIPKEDREIFFEILQHNLPMMDINYFNPLEISNGDMMVPVTSLFSSVQPYLEVNMCLYKAKKAYSFIMSHYSHRVWNGHHKGVYHLFGHSHGSLDNLPNGRSMDVGIDTAYKRYSKYVPYHIKQCIKICDGNEEDYLNSK